MKTTSKIIGATIAASVAASMAFIKPLEGNIGSYIDAGGKPTNCWGNTIDVIPGEMPTTEVCNDKMGADVRTRTLYIWSVLKPQPSLKTTQAFVSLSYNCGQSIFKETAPIPTLWNSGHYRAACIHITKICTTVKGRIINGLVKRRNLESKTCLSGLPLAAQ